MATTWIVVRIFVVVDVGMKMGKASDKVYCTLLGATTWIVLCGSGKRWYRSGKASEKAHMCA